MAIVKTTYNTNLRTPDSYTVECGNKRKMFDVTEKSKVGEWVKSVWENEFLPSPAYVYYNIGWDNDHILYCKYEIIGG